MKVRAIVWRTVAGLVLTGVAAVAVVLLAHSRGWFEPDVAGGPATVRLITPEQYLTTIHELFGEDISVEASFPPMQRRQGLMALGASTAVITPGALEQYDRAARAVVMQVMDEAHRPVLLPCTPTSPSQADAACAARFFSRVGRLLYRRPLTEAELEWQVSAAGEAAEARGDFYAGLGYSLAGMLTSPKFLYVTERTEPDPARPGQLRLDAYSKASRLSFLLWNAPPDEELLDAAQAGQLHDQKGLERQIERMLASARLEQGVRAFFSDMLAFDKFETLSKDSVIYPIFTRSVATSAKEQALQLITDHLLTQKGDYRNLFTTSRTFINAALGPLYQAAVPAPQEWAAHQLDQRYSAGLLTSISFLTLHSHPGRTSATLRGKAMREHLLCQSVPDPPPNVDFSNFENPDEDLKTLRERVNAHSADPVCAGCHKITDPIGLALENFDGAGQFRQTENDVPIDPSGTLDGKPFTDVASLGEALSEHPALASCLASRWYAYGVGRESTPADRRWLSFITKRFAVHGYRVPGLLRELASSRGFYAVSGRLESDTGNARAKSQIAAAVP